MYRGQFLPNNPRKTPKARPLVLSSKLLRCVQYRVILYREYWAPLVFSNVSSGDVDVVSFRQEHSIVSGTTTVTSQWYRHDDIKLKTLRFC